MRDGLGRSGDRSRARRACGLVKGVRFVSRIDQPDLLEVRGGRFGRQRLMIPVEQVQEVDVADERVIFRAVPDPSGDLLGGVVDRVRRALHSHQTEP